MKINRDVKEVFLANFRFQKIGRHVIVMSAIIL